MTEVRRCSGECAVCCGEEEELLADESDTTEEPERPRPREERAAVSPSPATHAILMQLKAGDLIHRV